MPPKDSNYKCSRRVGNSTPCVGSPTPRFPDLLIRRQQQADEVLAPWQSWPRFCFACSTRLLNVTTAATIGGREHGPYAAPGAGMRRCDRAL